MERAGASAVAHEQLVSANRLTRIDRDCAETAKYAAEQRKLEAESRQLDRNRWKIVVTMMTTGAAPDGVYEFLVG